MQSEIFRDSSTPGKIPCTTISIEIFDLHWKMELRNTNYSSRGDGRENESQFSDRIRFKEIPMDTIHGQDDPVILPCCFCLVVFLWTRTRHTPIFCGEKVEGRSQIRGILFTRRQLPDHDRTMTDSLPGTHLKDRISFMSLFIPERVPELFMLFTCIVQEGRLCPHWTKVAEMGKY